MADLRFLFDALQSCFDRNVMKGVLDDVLTSDAWLSLFAVDDDLREAFASIAGEAEKRSAPTLEEGHDDVVTRALVKITERARALRARLDESTAALVASQEQAASYEAALTFARSQLDEAESKIVGLEERMSDTRTLHVETAKVATAVRDEQQRRLDLAKAALVTATIDLPENSPAWRGAIAAVRALSEPFTKTRQRVHQPGENGRAYCGAADFKFAPGAVVDCADCHAKMNGGRAGRGRRHRGQRGAVMRQTAFRNAAGLADVLRDAKRQATRRRGAADVPMCQHGVAMRRCDDCGVFIASHPGVLPHVCSVAAASCADKRAGGVA